MALHHLGEATFQRAYAGGGWTTIAAGTRTIDMQRTAAVHIEKTTILGQQRLVLAGIARRSKVVTPRTCAPLAATVVAMGRVKQRSGCLSSSCVPR